jgi:hypothetical protein
VQPGQPGQRPGQSQLGGDPRAGLGDIHLDPLIGAREGVLGDEPLVDHRGPQRDVVREPGVDHRLQMLDQPGLRPDPTRW